MIRAQPITADAFKPFGDLISVGDGGAAMNQGTAVRFDWMAKIVNDRPGVAKLNVAAVRSIAKSLPFEMKLVEKHPFSSQMFIPMKCARFLVCVAPTLSSGSPDLTKILAFICGPGQGVNYAAGTWHHPIAALDEPAEFTLIVNEDGTKGDCVEQYFETPISVS